MVTKKDVAETMTKVFAECQKLRGHGQKEYAHEDDNALRNFESVGKYVGIEREKTLMVYLMKHVDGIAAFIKGHKSQREDVRGRINDGIVYLVLLRAMLDESES